MSASARSARDGIHVVRMNREQPVDETVHLALRRESAARRTRGMLGHVERNVVVRPVEENVRRCVASVRVSVSNTSIAPGRFHGFRGRVACLDFGGSG